MADNILKKQLGCISEDFLRGVFGRVGMPMWRALTHMFVAVTTGKSTLVTDIARTLRADSSRSDAKDAASTIRAEMLSRRTLRAMSSHSVYFPRWATDSKIVL